MLRVLYMKWPFLVAKWCKARVCDWLLAGIAVSIVPIAVAVGSKEWLCGRSFAGSRVAGSNPAGGMDVCVVLWQKAKCSTIKTKKQIRTKYRIQKKNPAGGRKFCVVCCAVKTKAQTRTIKAKNEVRKRYKERTREGLQKEISPVPWISSLVSVVCYFLSLRSEYFPSLSTCGFVCFIWVTEWNKKLNLSYKLWCLPQYQILSKSRQQFGTDRQTDTTRLPGNVPQVKLLQASRCRDICLRENTANGQVTVWRDPEIPSWRRPLNFWSTFYTKLVHIALRVAMTSSFSISCPALTKYSAAGEIMTTRRWWRWCWFWWWGGGGGRGRERWRAG